MPQAHRKSDVCTGHGMCSPRPTVAGSENVYWNHLNAQRIGDPYDTHCLHEGFCAEGSENVFVNSLGAVRVGDAVDCGGYAAIGSETIFINN